MPRDRWGEAAGGPARRVLAATLVLALLAGALGACTNPRESVDCDQALNEGRYNTVIAHCDNPYQLASAYLGLAGFDTFALVDSTAPPGKVAGLLGLTAANVNQKRLLINQAVDVVKNPNGGNQAFALLIASFLGLAVTMEQFLDNGIVDTAGTVDPAKVLDDILEPSETEGALGFVTTAPAVTVFGSTAPAYYSVLSGGTPYVLDCSADATCGSAAARVYDDTFGAGIPDSATESANKAAVIAGAATVTSPGYVTQIASITTGIGLSAATQEPVNSFLGSVSASGTFNIGLAGYLAYLHIADTELSAAGGSTGGSQITIHVDALTSKLDNGAACATSNATLGPIVGLMNEFYAIYAQAPGSAASPVSGTPAAGAFAGRNLVKATDLPSLSLFFLPPPPLPVAPVFPLSSYKFVYPTVAGLAAFDATQATARVDQAPAAFQTEFENIPVFASAAAAVGDGKISLLEILCASD